ncbi:peptidylprolyl isomerase [Thermosulfidibacter takaii ABI70S6]|uniref:Peptidylprolyl isomerase n=1 Tax=Thermosulfidibacter takaii (strain DSM 17441 / JCM 13301 / NBRC 103674 / ABI70S6) TaxID=1298851 RepID=A0A0S3QRU6_THET7|nr:TonB-dependent receptor [Thermosulfidibacter takaii]BAT71045.1 peptidylprolyl isomerase [Thermosulfidibacter takaii ABI70S6]
MKKLCMLLMILAFALPSFAGSGNKPTRLKEVVVTATATRAEVERLPVHVEVITRREIERSNADNLGDLLAEKLPEHIHKYPGLLTSVALRGFRTDTHGTDIKGRVLILVDGHRAGTGNVAEIPLENVERIEIVKGPASVLYGSAAMGGVINVITRKGKGKPTVFSGIKYGSWDYNKQYAGAYGEIGKLNFSFSLSKSQRNDYETGDGKEIDNTDYHDWKGGFRIGLTPAEHHEISLTGQMSEFWKIGSPGPTYYPDKDNYKDVRRKYISFAYDAQWKENLSSHLSYYYVQDSSEWHDPSKSWGYSETKTITNTQGLRLKTTYEFNKLIKLTTGVDWDGIRTKNTKYPKSSGSPYSPNAAYDNYAGYIQTELFYSKLYVVAGVRYDYWNEELRPTQRMVLKEDEEDYDHVTWRIGASYFLTDWLKVRAAVGTAYRTPTADELSGYFKRPWQKIVGNPDLDPEKSTTYEAGVDIFKNSLKAGVGYFYTNYRDRISGGYPTCVDGDCSWTTYKNVDGAHIGGVEFYGQYDFGELFNLPFIIKPYLNGVLYTTMKIKDKKYADELGTDQIPYISKWNLTGGLDLELPEKASLDVSFFYVGKQKVQEWNWFKPNVGEAVNKGGFTVFNAKFTVTPCKHARFFIGVDNVFDKNYSFVKYYPMPGRAIYTGIEVKF